uniref:Solute carrier family 16 member 7 n=1 Tax=Sinocyclocheilus grahami TaxID=75366 RepID=A0A672QN21_SINGR
MPPPATTNLGYTPPDGGWGWAVVFGPFISIGFSYAFPKSLTIYFKEIQSWVSSIMLATLHAGGFGLAFNLQPALTIIGLPVHPGFGLAFNLQPALTIIGLPVHPGSPQPRSGAQQLKLPVSKTTDKNDGMCSCLLDFFAPVVFLAPYAKHQGIDEYSAAFLLSIFALVDMFARPGTGLIANTRWIRPKIQYFFSFAVTYNGLCHMMCSLLPGYSGLVVFFGLAFGMVCALLFEILMDLVGAQWFSSAVGLATIIECGPVLLGFLSSGFLVDIFMDCKYMYFACGMMMLAGGIFLFIMNYYSYRWSEKEQNQIKMEGLERSAQPKSLLPMRRTKTMKKRSNSAQRRK